MKSHLSPEETLTFLWVVWALSWMAAAVWSDRPVKRAGRTQELPYNIMTAIAVILLFGFRPLDRHFLWRMGPNAAWGMVALAILGFSFSWWARVHLGRLWSRWIVRKADHRIIQTGPYSIVRHPIYTGISLAALATATMIGTVLAFLGAGLMILSWYIKARLEERFLREQLNTEAYDAYARRVPMLVPLLRI